MTKVLSEAYRVLSEDGRPVTRADIKADVTRLFRSNAAKWMKFRED
jgi:hypothetical protein